MDKIYTRKINETNMYVTSERSIERELWEYFSFQVPGYKFTPQYKKGGWDGYLRGYNLNTKMLYIGLRFQLQRFADENGLEVIDEVPVLGTVEFTRPQVSQWLDDDPNTVHGRPVELRDYQREAIIKAIVNKRIIIESPTGSGKSLILFKICKFLQLAGKRILLQVPSTMLVEQMYKDFQDYATGTDFDIETTTQRVYAKFDRVVAKPIVISTWQTQHSTTKKTNKVAYMDQFDVVLQDEVHLAKANAITSLMESATNSQYKIGCTGTLDKAKCHRSVLEGLFGPPYKAISTKQLMDRGQVAALDIKVLQLKYAPEDCKAISQAKEYQLEIDWLVTNAKRNTFIANLAISRPGNTLILTTFVEKHGKPLYDMICEKAAEGRPIYFIHGDVETEVRETIREALETHHNAIVVATYSLMSTGVSIRNLHNIIFASPSKSLIRVLQSVGRGLRIGDNKSRCTLFDIVDNLTYKKHKNFAWAHGAERVSIYSSEQFDFKMFDVPLEV